MSGLAARLAYIDALRGLAAAGVVLTHVGTMAQLEGPARLLTGAAGTGVQLFFVVSAFTILLSLEENGGRGSYRDFYIKRLCRIFPLYWFGIAFYFAIYGFDSRGFKPGPEPWHFLLHATLMNIWHPATTTSVVPGGWSISVEVLFYLTVPFWLAFVRDTRTALIALFGMIAIGMTVPPVLSALLDPVFFSGTEPFILRQYWAWSFPSQVGCFGFGILLYFVLRENRLAGFIEGRRSLWLFALAGLVATVAALRLTPIPGHLVFSAAYFLLALGLSQWPVSLLVNRLTLFAGRISYSIYLMHFFVLVQVMPLLRDAGLSGLPLAVVGFVVTFAVTCALSVVTYSLIEKPAIQFGRTLIARRRARPAPALNAG